LVVVVLFVVLFPRHWNASKLNNISWHFQLDLATAPQARLFLSRIIKLLINATLFSSPPCFSSTFPFNNNAASHLFVNMVTPWESSNWNRKNIKKKTSWPPISRLSGDFKKLCWKIRLVGPKKIFGFKV